MESTDIITQTLTLAPAAGSGIGKALADALTADPEFLPLLIEAAKDGLKAERSFWGGKELYREPDTRSRIQTLALVLAHMEGEPVKRIIHQHVGDGKPVDPIRALAESPAMRDELRKLLQKSEWKESGRQAHKRPAKKAIEVVDDSAPSQSQ